MAEILNITFQVVTYIILIYFFSLNFFYLVFTILSIFGVRHYRNITAYVRYKELFHLPSVKPISIIAPAFNEENTIIENVHSLLSLEYPQYEVIIVNDGSKDSTLKRLISSFDLKKTNHIFRKVINTKKIKGIYASPSIQNLIVIDKENGKKADALNAGLNISKYSLFCAIDSDSLLEKDSLLKIVRPFLEDPEKTVAATGVIRLSNGCDVKSGQVINIKMPREYLACFQIIEYLRAFLGGRLGLNMAKSILIISGAFGLFRKDIVLQCGGYRTNTVGEDMDLIIRMKRQLHENKIPYRIHFIPDAVCWTEAPESLRILAKQRNRWHRGLIEAITHNFKMFLNPRYGITGLFAMPFYVIFEMLGPLIEFAGYIIFAVFVISGRVYYPFAWLFFLLAVILGIILSLLSILLEEFSLRKYPRLSDILTITLAGVLENLFYRQFLSLVRVKAFLDLILGKKEWGEMKRKGFSKIRKY